MKRRRNNRSAWIFVILSMLVCLFVIVAGTGYFVFTEGQGLPPFFSSPTPSPTPTSTSTPVPTLTPLPTATSTPAETPTLPPTATEAIKSTGSSPVIYLAGRTDITIPLLGEPSDVIIFVCRNNAVVQEAFPPGYRIQPGAEFTIRATGQINFYGRSIETGYPPDGDPNGSLANIAAFGGISAYKGIAGALVGVFLDDNLPTGTPPDPINYASGQEGAIGAEFVRLEPQLGQVFFIGDGLNPEGQQQVFVAPPGATRLFIGLADSTSFNGNPTCYADNVGSFEYELESNQAFEPLP